MKILLPLLLVLAGWLVACRSAASPTPSSLLSAPSGLVEVTILAKGLE